MTDIELLILVATFVLTSAVSVVTGSTSHITVPALLQFGVEPQAALATNMFALTFMSVGARCRSSVTGRLIAAGCRRSSFLRSPDQSSGRYSYSSSPPARCRSSFPSR
jgi:hypothetical protein